MPMVAQPTASVADEPAPQKPDLKLPADAIRASRSGAKPLQEHLRKHEAKRKADVAKAKPAAGHGPARYPAPGSDGRPVATADARRPSAGRKGRRIRSRAGRARAAAAQPQARGHARTFPPIVGGEDEQVGRIRRSRPKQKRSGLSTAAPRKSNVVVHLPATVRSFSEAIGIPVPKVLSKLLALGTNLSTNAINSELDAERVELLAIEFGVEVELKHAQSLEDQLLGAIDSQEDDPAQLLARAAGRDVPGARRPWQDVALGPHHRHRRGQRRERRHYAAHSRLSCREGRTHDLVCRYAGPRGFHGDASTAAPTSPTSRCWSWRPTTALCRRPKKRSVMPAPRECRSSWR